MNIVSLAFYFILKVVMLLVMGRALYKEWLDKDKLVLLQGWKRAGLTDVQISQNMGVSVFTLDKWKRNYSQIRQALKRGRSEINYIVENALLKKALEGNVTAMIFFLKNNWRDKYNDSQLSKEERELVLANIKKTKAEARIKEAKAIIAERLGDESNAKLEELLNKIVQGDSSGTTRFTDKETN